MKLSKLQAHRRRRLRVRQIVTGAPERPRICVHRSNRHVSAQVIDDLNQKTLAAVTSVAKDNVGKSCCSCANATTLGKKLGEKMKAAGITTAIFDRNGYLYHGVVKAFADGVRSADEENHFNF
jgi:large subunit ribosomal protein L18